MSATRYRLYTLSPSSDYRYNGRDVRTCGALVARCSILDRMPGESFWGSGVGGGHLVRTCTCRCCRRGEPMYGWWRVSHLHWRECSSIEWGQRMRRLVLDGVDRGRGLVLRCRLWRGFFGGYVLIVLELLCNVSFALLGHQSHVLKSSLSIPSQCR